MTYNSLIEFESYRKESKLIPPEGSNSFYEVGDGTINLMVLSKEPTKFKLYTNTGSMESGNGNFLVSNNDLYTELYVIAGTKLTVNDTLTIDSGVMDVYGSLELSMGSSLIIKNKSKVVMYADSMFSIRAGANITIEDGSSLTIYGNINVHLNSIDNILGIRRITIDSAAVMIVDGMKLLGQRHFSLTDYDTYLRTQVITEQTQGNLDTSNGRMSYTWVAGSTSNKSQILKMTIPYGEVILGDFKYSVLGIPEVILNNFQQISELVVGKRATLYVSSNYKDYNYIRPDLYIGHILNNTDIPGKLTIEGTCIVSGENSSITLDRGGSLHLVEGAELWLKNNGKLKCTNNDPDNPIFILDGTLYIDDIEQISTFSHNNIIIGEKGKIVIFNPEKETRRVLFSTPIGIEKSDLYRLFRDRIDHIVYHVHNNTGIVIDKYYEWYSRDMTKWFGDRRIEKAIQDGILVWHSGGFIELHRDTIPWATKNASLLEASRLFKTSASFDDGKLQEAVNQLKYAGSGNIKFRFVDIDASYSEATMILEEVNMKNAVRYPTTDTYVVTTDNDGQIFLRNKVSHPTEEVIVRSDSKIVDIRNKKAEFSL